jgi:serine-type D-Ala-D-Ala carboxypeptidase/endopeptidase (penicillin-binding protein 4)
MRSRLAWLALPLLALLSAPALAQSPPSPLVSVLAPMMEDRALEGAEVAVQVVEVRSGQTVFSHGADQALMPASVMKSITSAAALKTLGPNFRFSTSFRSTAELDEDGVLDGDLYVKGTGDPTLVVEKLWKMVQDLKLRGLTSIDGDVVLDDTHFDSEYLISGWGKKVDIASGPSYFAPLGALSLNYNTVSIVVIPGPNVGSDARVVLETPAHVVELESTIKTVGRGRKGWAKVEREIDPKTHVLKFKLEGEIALDSDPDRHYRAVHDPLSWTGSVLKGLLEKEKIKVSGRYRRGETPNRAEELAGMLSPPLGEILNHTNKYSSNFMAETVLKAMGAAKYDAPGTTAKGLRVISGYLESLGVPSSDYQLVNGSGLSEGIRIKPSVTSAVLVDMYRDPRVGPEYMSSLAVSGGDGTLRNRFDEKDEEGRLRGKTGSIDGVFCLTGYAHALSGEVYAFTVLANNFRRSSAARSLQDRVGQALLEWTGQGPDGATAASPGGR